MRYHPEQSTDEVYLGNRTGELPDYLKRIPLIRLGKAAYDLDGNLIDDEPCHPLFVKQGADADRYDQIMMAGLSAIKRGY